MKTSTIVLIIGSVIQIPNLSFEDNIIRKIVVLLGPDKHSFKAKTRIFVDLRDCFSDLGSGDDKKKKMVIFRAFLF